MKAFNKSAVSIVVVSVVLVGSFDVARAAVISTDDVQDSLGWTQTQINKQFGDQTQGNYDRISNVDGDVIKIKQENLLRDDAILLAGNKAGQALQQNVVNGSNILTLQNDVGNLKGDISNVDREAKLAGVLADTANKKGDAALTGVAANGNAIITVERINGVQDSRLDALEKAPKATNGINGKDRAKGDKGDTGAQGAAGLKGKDGVTTTVTKMQVDTVTQAKVVKNSQTITTTAQDLQATKQTLQAINNNSNQQFKSLHDEVDNNRKQANAGISGAMAMAGLPQVQTNQHVMFSAGGATYNGESALAVGASVNFNANVIAKVSFSDDTANNMGASVGVGMGF
ncbi:YadA C-terminal domain-containing protein [Enterobacter wuhouensis]|uniref:YadA C-terminal domain-containing protein n=1 Tax=Enterobacter wuhouensis TaxID=2529381 RepID=UPI003D779673